MRHFMLFVLSLLVVLGSLLYPRQVEANPGDVPQIMNALVKGFGEVANAIDRIYTVHFIGNGSYDPDC